jgi:hypothetical protein
MPFWRSTASGDGDDTAGRWAGKEGPTGCPPKNATGGHPNACVAGQQNRTQGSVSGREIGKQGLEM